MWGTVLLGVLVSVLTAPKEVTLTDEQIQAWGLQKSAHYWIYTEEEHKQVTTYVRYQEKLIASLKLKIELIEDNNEDLKKQIELYKISLNSMTSMKEFLWSTWVRCDKDLQLARAGSWWPWVVTAAVAIGGLVASGFAIRYRYK